MEKRDRWQVVSASVAGTSHEKREQPCQDANRWEILPEGILVAAVADGAGSAILGDVGSRVAVDAAIEAIRQHKETLLANDAVWYDILLAALKATRMAVETESEKQQVELRDLASTLILVVAMSEMVIAVQVGDGAAVVGDREDRIFPLTVPDSGEHINETTFLISENALEAAQVKIWRGKLAHLAMFSDGLQMLALKMPLGLPHNPFFLPLFQFVAAAAESEDAQQQLESFLRSPRVTQRTDDDLTLLLARFD